MWGEDQADPSDLSWFELYTSLSPMTGLVLATPPHLRDRVPQASHGLKLGVKGTCKSYLR